MTKIKQLQNSRYGHKRRKRNKKFSGYTPRKVLKLPSREELRPRDIANRISRCQNHPKQVRNVLNIRERAYSQWDLLKGKSFPKGRNEFIYVGDPRSDAVIYCLVFGKKDRFTGISWNMSEDLQRHIELARQMQWSFSLEKGPMFDLDRFGALLAEIGVNPNSIDARLDMVKRFHRVLSKSGRMKDLYLIPLEKFKLEDWIKEDKSIMNIDERKEWVKRKFKFWNSRLYRN